MKDIPHHIKKLNRQVIRSMHREEVQEELPDVPTWPETPREKKKKRKKRKREQRKAQPVDKKSPEERNQIQKRGRVPVIDRNNALPVHNRPTHKKTPRI